MSLKLKFELGLLVNESIQSESSLELLMNSSVHMQLYLGNPGLQYHHKP